MVDNFYGKKSRVFISYTHDSEAHKKQVKEFSDKLVIKGVDCWCDQYVTGTPERGWPMWMHDQVTASDYILVVCTELYLSRFNGEEIKGKGLGAKFESALVLQMLYEDDTLNKRIIPVMFSSDCKSFIPLPLKSATYYNLEFPTEFEKIYRVLTDQNFIVRPPLGDIEILPTGPNYSMPATSTDTLDIDSLEVDLLPNIPELTMTVPAGIKIVQAFFALSMTERFSIGRELKLLENGENELSQDKDRISSEILVRAQKNGLLGALWGRLFDESINPNPYLNNQ